MTHYSRDEWGGRKPTARYRLDPLRVRGVALHWPGSSTRYGTVSGVAAALRAFQRAHMDTDQIATGGASDIAYQLAFDQAGNTYGLRGMRYRSAANGGTAVNEEYGAFLLMIGIGETPTPALIRAVRARVGRHRDLFPNSRLIVGHGDIRPSGPTACPGPIVGDLIADGKFGNPTKR